jgi:transcriptional regulator with XRE-family HTH domain
VIENGLGDALPQFIGFFAPPITFEYLLDGLPPQLIGPTPLIEGGAVCDEYPPHGRVKVFSWGEGDWQSARDIVYNAQKYAYFCAMSNEITDAFLAERLREVLKLTGKSQRHVSRALEVPYRSVQTYLAGETRIPATFLLAICQYLELEPDYLITGDFRPRRLDLYDAVIRGLDDMDLLPDRAILANSTQRVTMAGQITATIREAYDRYRRNSLFKGREPR